ncbi:MAG: ORC1-type DNA replication protein [Candidatus Heimdallarchaeota archaeon]|nr:ORC1-type DNA replication protein [Candidatus Heimdallarchaeota archaeon]MCK5297628.1 ORC1-type DNA replication protein [Candidatus Heimdallarchaeota archaeon]
MDELLEKELRKPTLIKNPRVLDLKYIPKKLLHREEEQKMLIQYFKPVIEKPGEYSQRVSIIGAIGSGKTAVALKFGEMVKVYSTQKNLNLEYVHVNCRRARSAFLTLLEIVRKFNPHIPVRGFSPEEILNMLTEILNRKRLYLIVTLDEIDFVIRKDGPDLLYDLTRLTDDKIDMKERVSIITIVRDIAFRTMLDESTLSTLRQNTIFLEPYNEDQLRDIIADRIKEAFYEDVVSKEAADLIADIASKNGDARYAIELLERAGMHADHRQSLKVLPEHVRHANASIHPVIRQEIVKDLTTQQKLILLAISIKLKTTQKAYTTMGEVEEAYKRLCEEFTFPVRSHTQLWEYVQYLQNCDVITTKISSKGQRGQTTLIGLPDVSAEKIENAIREQLEKQADK